MSNDQCFGKAEFHYRAQHVEGDKFRDGWDRIFGKKAAAPATEEIPTTRYFTDGEAFWKFTCGEKSQIRLAHWDYWNESIFRSIEAFLCEPDLDPDIREITAEEGEP